MEVALREIRQLIISLRDDLSTASNDLESFRGESGIVDKAAATIEEAINKVDELDDLIDEVEEAEEE